MTPSILPIMLSAGGGVKTGVNSIVLTSVYANPMLKNIVSTSDIRVKTTYNGSPHTETYPSNTTQISLSSDPNTPIYVFGDISQIDHRNTYEGQLFESITIKSRALSLLCPYSSGADDSNLKVVNVKVSNNLSLQLNRCAVLTNINIANGCSITEINATDSKLLAEIRGLQDLSGLQTLNLSGCNSLSELTLPVEKILTSCNISKCYSLREADFSNQTSLTDLNASGCYSLENVSISGDVSLSTLNIGDTAISAVDLSGTAVTTLKASACQNMVRLDLQDAPLLTTLTVSNSSNLKSVLCSKNHALTSITFSKLASLETLDLSGSEILTTVQPAGNMPTKIKLIKYRATDSAAATAVASLIASADANDGVVYLNSADTYYSTVADAATAKGWTIEPLA